MSIPIDVQCTKCGSSGELGTVCANDEGVFVSAMHQAEHLNDPLLGKVLDQRYAVFAVIGQGGMGVVYRARQLAVGRDVAIKTLLGTPTASDVTRFLREQKIVASLESPNAVTLFDSGQTDNGLYMVMELIRGETLRQMIDRERLPLRKSVQIMIDVLNALIEAHGQGLVHRDIKPANIMITPLQNNADRVRVLDFGIAKVLDGVWGEIAPGSVTGQIMGTVSYMSPEQSQGWAVGPATDLYACGCVLYELLTGAPPFVRGSSLAVLFAQVHERPTDLPKFVPPALAEIVACALKKKAESRFESASAMRHALQAVLGSLSVKPSPLSEPSVDIRPLPEPSGEVLPSSEPTGRPVALITGLGLLGIVAFIWAMWPAPPPPPDRSIIVADISVDQALVDAQSPTATLQDQGSVDAVPDIKIQDLGIHVDSRIKPKASRGRIKKARKKKKKSPKDTSGQERKPTTVTAPSSMDAEDEDEDE